MKDSVIVLIISIAVLVIAAFATRPLYIHADANPYHSRTFVSAYGGLPDTLNSLFTGSGKCAGCHGSDPNFYASIPGQSYPATPMPGEWDVNPTDFWRSSMMANSAKDPFWRAKVAHEVAINPEHQAELEDKCTSCHAPLGNLAAAHIGIDHYSIEMMISDSLALDGVSCVACHQQSADSSGFSFSGDLKFDSAVIYGPYGIGEDEPPLYDLPMNTYTGYDVMHGEHMVNSDVCADCHTLLTNSVDLEGNFTGEMYVEQATYHEWLNSAFSGEGIEIPDEFENQEASCQSCHMPIIEEPVIISSGYAFLEPRTPYGLHTLVGANTAMLEILRDNVEELGLTATAEQFDSTIAYTRNMLLEQSIELEVFENLNYESLAFTVLLNNKAGHKFPSGYPSRRAFVEAIVVFNDDTLFHSGKMDASGSRILGADDFGLETFEPHHDVITDESQVLIYEIVPADINNNPTNVLEQAFVSVKDNRLVPRGFSMNHSAYDTTSLAGAVLDDPNFNIVELSGENGSGNDRVTYNMPDNQEFNSIGWDNPASITVNVYYQSMPPRWIESMFDWDLQPISTFQTLFEEHGSAAVLVASNSSLLMGVNSIDETNLPEAVFTIGPNPTSDGFTNLYYSNLTECTDFEVYNVSGELCSHGTLDGNQGSKKIEFPHTKGMYLVRISSSNGSAESKSLQVIVR
ncbi:MAG: T9SS type A sorting domain-containing protein [Flavobacteriales bacterium]|nr:T9SS type A sorting domain-containing protein [Flavobacteriales bacterium]